MHLVGPSLEVQIPGDATIQHQPVVGSAARSLVIHAVFTAAAVRDHVSGPFERTSFHDAEHRMAVPLELKLVILIWIDSVSVFLKSSCHDVSPVVPVSVLRLTQV